MVPVPLGAAAQLVLLELLEVIELIVAPFAGNTSEIFVQLFRPGILGNLPPDPKAYPESAGQRRDPEFNRAQQSSRRKAMCRDL